MEIQTLNLLVWEYVVQLKSTLNRMAGTLSYLLLSTTSELCDRKQVTPALWALVATFIKWGVVTRWSLRLFLIQKCVNIFNIIFIKRIILPLRISNVFIINPLNQGQHIFAIKSSLAYFDSFLIIFACIKMKHLVKIKHYMQMSTTSLLLE